MATPETLRRYLWQVAGSDPRYMSFLAAQGITPEAMNTNTKYQKMMEKHRTRINTYMYYWNMYLGHHWLTLQTEESEMHPVKVNHCAANVNKHAAFLMNKGFLVESNFPEIEQFLQHNWELNNGGLKEYNLFGMEIAIQGGITGDVWFDMLFDKHPRSGEEYIKFTILDSTKCFPVLERKKIIGLLYYGPEEVVQSNVNGFAMYRSNMGGYYYAPGQLIRIESEEMVPTSTQTFDVQDLPLVHVQNFPIPISYYGLSDLLNSAELNTEFDDIITNIKEIIAYHASPITIVKGARAGDLVRGANRVWSLPQNADISNLKLEGDLTAIVSHMKNIRESIAEMTNVPESTIGKLQNISNTSGAALAITFMPLYEVMELKRITYGKAILEANAYAIKMAFLRGLLSPSDIIKAALDRWNGEFTNYSKEIKDQFYPFRDEVRKSKEYDKLSGILTGKVPHELYETYLTWFPPLPRDEKLDADMAIAMAGAKLWSKRHARSVVGMPEKESVLMNQEINKESMDDLKLQQEVMKMTNAAKPLGPNTPGKTGLEGNPAVKGEEESLRVSQEAGV